MADLFHRQAKNYAESRPSYPEELFEFIASKTPNHDLVWDAGTGSGQAAKSFIISRAGGSGIRSVRLNPPIPSSFQHFLSSSRAQIIDRIIDRASITT